MRRTLGILLYGALSWGCGDATLEANAEAEGARADGSSSPHDGDGAAPDSDAGDMGIVFPRGDARVPDPEAVFEAAPPTLYRLTRVQYLNSLRDLLGDVRLPDDLEDDTPLHGFASVGASEVTLSPRAVEQFETAAHALMEQVFTPDRRAAFTGCDAPTGDCVRTFFATFGRRAWRRPLTDAELDLWVGKTAELAELLQDGWRGLQFAAAGLLQSPDFVFRVEHGEADGAGRRFTDYEMAARLSYVLWNTTPDAELLDAAERGELTTEAGLRAQGERLLADPRARATVRDYFAEYFNLSRLDSLEKDRDLFPQMSATLGRSMRTEIESVIDDLVFEKDADLRALLTTRSTFVNAELAALYNLPAVEADGFVRANLPANGPRAGLMGMAGILALNAHNTVTSPTHRGKFIQNFLLCVDIPPPPPGTVTNLEEIPEDQPITTREKLARHASDPVCAGCHQFMDPLGLALENFDPVGAWRTTEQGLPIDASSEIDGVTFTGAAELGALLQDREAIAACVARRLFRHATGQLEGPGQERAVADLADVFTADDYRFQALLIALVTSDGFRRTGAVE